MAENQQVIEGVLKLRDELSKPAAVAGKNLKAVGDEAEKASRRAGTAFTGLTKRLIGVGTAIRILAKTDIGETFSKALDVLAFGIDEVTKGVGIGKLGDKLSHMLNLKSLVEARETLDALAKADKDLGLGFAETDGHAANFARVMETLTQRFGENETYTKASAEAYNELTSSIFIAMDRTKKLAQATIIGGNAARYATQILKLDAAAAKLFAEEASKAFLKLSDANDEMIIRPDFSLEMAKTVLMMEDLNVLAEKLPTNFDRGFNAGINMIRTAEELGAALSSTFQGVLNDIGDAILEARTFDEALRDILKNLARVFLNQAFGQITGGVGGLFGVQSTTPSAKGNVFSGGNVIPFAGGGAFTNKVVSRPTMAPMALFGENPPGEAIMPLANKGGVLGVMNHGGGGGPTIINHFHISAMDSRDVIRALSDPEVRRYLNGNTASGLGGQHSGLRGAVKRAAG